MVFRLNNLLNEGRIIDLCPAGQTLSPQDRLFCRWIIPAKYFVRQIGDDRYHPKSFEVRVPWSDIDPDFSIGTAKRVSFQFWPEGIQHHPALRYKNMGKAWSDNNGILWLKDTALFFKGFDETEVYVDLSFYVSGSVIRIYRPLGDGTMYWIVPLPAKFESKEAKLNYLKNNIDAIDRKLMEFVSQWH